MIISGYTGTARFTRAWVTSPDFRKNLGEISFMLGAGTHYATIDEAVSMSLALQIAIGDYYKSIRDEADAVLSGAMYAAGDQNE